MPKASFTLTFKDDTETTRTYETAVEFSAKGSVFGKTYLAEFLALELKKELIWGDYMAEFPHDLEDLLKPVKKKRRVRASISEFKDAINVSRLWLEMGNNLLQTRILLVRSKAYKSIEPPHNADFSKNNLLYNIHAEKMLQFDRAVHRLAKVEDLMLRLVHEALGGSLVRHDPADPEWERKLTVRNVAAALKNRGGNPALSKLGDEEYGELFSIISELRQPDFMDGFLEYRNCLTHRIALSVDYTEFFVALEDRKEERTVLENGSVRIVSHLGAVLTTPRYEFAEVYELARQAFQHYTDLLKRLRALERFG